ncbi:uncharacterized protein Z518_08353 [Rhinocladiella mackenziei CBS 650.93]|uniref:Uncharacterized protein n=1 Tax=Rhinocladiella mackenziei CBS 650.93 TaxID=1442369 RepID=A0A0D2FKD0_9EURO|nr:uncharacterized protein Z518_08353 [Rhinocladiella mackenziei CBS 650.93]KIX02412.1 hypothetical protein Z518_08353 [Rhinocladiella mackenziei CBS 650.93]
MDGPLPEEMGPLKSLLDHLGTEICRFVGDNTKQAQEDLQMGLTATKDELAFVKKELEETKAMVHSQVECFRGFFTKSPTDDLKPDYMRAEHPDSMMVDNVTKGSRTKKHEDLEKNYTRLRGDYRNLFTEHQETVQSLNAAQQRLEESEKRQRALRVQVGRLQGHITRNATNANELIDSEVKGKLEHIRARIQSIVKKYCVGKVITIARPSQELVNFDNEWLKRSKPLLQQYTQHDVEEFATYWVRSKIYFLLEREIFSKEVFGLEDDLEAKFGEFERLIVKHNPDTDIGDWRALTLRYSKALNMEHQQLPRETALYILHLFIPWVAANPENAAPTKGNVKQYYVPPQLKTDLAEICQAAYDLTVMLRQSADKYYFVPIEEDTRVDSQEHEYFEPDHVIGSTSEYVGSKVWVTLFGALVKESQAGERYIMQKARVICKAPPPLPDRPKDE